MPTPARHAAPASPSPAADVSRSGADTSSAALTYGALAVLASCTGRGELESASKVGGVVGEDMDVPCLDASCEIVLCRFVFDSMRNGAPALQEMIFFFSSRRRHTSCGRDWSSGVCSSDLFASVRVRYCALQTAKEKSPMSFLKPSVPHLSPAAITMATSVRSLGWFIAKSLPNMAIRSKRL